MNINVFRAPALGALLAVAGAANAAEQESCRKVRLAEPGWNDLAFTTGVAQALLLGITIFTAEFRVLAQLNQQFIHMRNNTFFHSGIHTRRHFIQM